MTTTHRSHFLGRAVDIFGNAKSGVGINIYLADTLTPANVYLTQEGSSSIATAPQVLTDDYGRFSFWVSDEDYNTQQLFDIDAAGLIYEDIKIINTHLMDKTGTATAGLTNYPSESIRFKASAFIKEAYTTFNWGMDNSYIANHPTSIVGVPVGSPIFSASVKKTGTHSLYLADFNNDSVTFPITASHLSPAEGQIGFWYRQAAQPLFAGMKLVVVESSAGSSEQISFGLNLSNGKARIKLSFSPGNESTALPDYDLEINTWYFIAGAWDVSEATTLRIQIYDENLVLLDTKTNDSGPFTAWTNDPVALKFQNGNESYFDNFLIYPFFYGDIAHLANFTHSAQDVVWSIWGGAIGGFPLPGKFIYAGLPDNGGTGIIKTAILIDGGLGYTEGDTCYITTEGNTSGVFRVLSVDGSGTILTFEIMQRGDGFTDGTKYLSGGTSPAIIEITVDTTMFRIGGSGALMTWPNLQNQCSSTFGTAVVVLTKNEGDGPYFKFNAGSSPSAYFLRATTEFPRSNLYGPVGADYSDYDLENSVILSCFTTEEIPIVKFDQGGIQLVSDDTVDLSVPNIKGQIRPVSEAAVDAAAWQGGDFLTLGSGDDVITFTPKFVGQKVTVYCPDSTADATLTTGSGVTFDGTNDVATFESDGSALVLQALSLTRWLVIKSEGTVTFS